MINISYIHMLQDIKRVITLKRYALLFSILFTAVFILYFYLLESSATGIIDFGSYYIYFDLLSAFAKSNCYASMAFIPADNNDIKGWKLRCKPYFSI